LILMTVRGFCGFAVLRLPDLAHLQQPQNL